MSRDGTGRPPGGLGAVVLAGGSGTRFGAAHNKPYASLAGRRALTWGVETLVSIGLVTHWVIVTRPQDRDLLSRILDREIGPLGVVPDIVDGGDTRHESEYRALEHLRTAIGRAEIDTVLLHDAARPLASGPLISELVETARRCGAAVPCIEDDDLRARRPDGSIDFAATDGSRLARCQTPQVFGAGELLRVYDLAERDGFRGTDTASCWEEYSDVAVTPVLGDPRNLKITYPRDLFLADALLRAADFDLS